MAHFHDAHANGIGRQESLLQRAKNEAFEKIGPSEAQFKPQPLIGRPPPHLEQLYTRYE
ncbi:hypothetical protein KC352_g43383, partial [Hortaea werneckii]